MNLRKSYLTFPMLIFLVVDIIIGIFSLVMNFVFPASAAAWVGWFFASVVGWVSAYCTIRFIAKDEQTRLLKYNAIHGTSFVFEILYCIVFAIARFALNDAPWWAAIIVGAVDVVILIAYFAYMFKSLFALAVLDDVNRDQAKVMEQKNTSYIPEISSMISASIALCADDGIKAQLATLLASLSQSPLASPPELQIVEDELKALCFQINNFVTISYTQQVPALIAQATAKLMERNMKCNAGAKK